MLDNDMALVDVGGVRKDVSLSLVSDVNVGDFVIVHVGYALTKLDPDEAEKTLQMFAQMAVESEAATAENLPERSPLGSQLSTLDP